MARVVIELTDTISDGGLEGAHVLFRVASEPPIDEEALTPAQRLAVDFFRIVKPQEPN